MSIPFVAFHFSIFLPGVLFDGSELDARNLL
jgi:hypothetical protein